MSFQIGQRWISESESELGLGLIVGVDVRRVTILFPAAQEQRVYAKAAAPLIRVSFQVQDIITHHEGWQAKVLEVMENNGLLIYQGERCDNGQRIVLAETELAQRIAFGKPQDRLFAAQIDRSDRFALRYRSLCYQQAQFRSALRGLRGVRAGLIPHQLHIAREVGRRIAPRVLLADEVGLGKTLEAGMILQQQLFSGRVERVLIIVPENLQHQWLVEMLRRFNLHFSLFDEARCTDFEGTEEEEKPNPFSSESMIICALDWLLARPERAEQLYRAEFDLLIMDEAHHLSWTQGKPNRAYALVEGLAHNIPALLLLSATPEQLGRESHFARLRLLDPHRFHDYQAFLEEQQQYRPVAEAVQALLKDSVLDERQKKVLAQLLAPQDSELLLSRIDSNVDENKQMQAKQQLIQRLIDRHGTGRLLFRNTRRGVKGFPRRIYRPISLEMPQQYRNAARVMALLGEKVEEALFYPERLFQQINPDAEWWCFDPRLDWLSAFLKSVRQEKVLLICRHADSAVQLARALREKEGIHGALFHENMSLTERDRAAAYFAEEESGAQILLCSHIGSEGRNFQFASHLILFDLPTHPDLLEQAIGRLDRIGQCKDIQIHVPYFAHSAQSILAQWYHLGLNAFEATCPAGALLFEKCGQKLQSFYRHPDKLEGFDALLEETRNERLSLHNELERGRDRLLEIHSNGGAAAQQLAADIAQEEQSPALSEFALNLFDLIGLEQEDSGEKSILISPSATMLVPDFPGLKEEGLNITFDRQLALAREELEFISWDHPLIRQGLDLICGGDIGKTAVALLPNKALPPGTILLELIYCVEVQAPKQLQLSRFLPPTPIRLLLDAKGNDLAEKVAFEGLEKQLKPMKKNSAIQIVKMTKERILGLIAEAEKNMARQCRQICAQAGAEAQLQLGAELERLQALSAVNKNIRPQEIQSLARLKEQSLALIEQAVWRLDSLRLILTNNEPR
ncbi:ATP-dependent helicase HepA [Mesocricetibacter intestinalis]|uniref:RNA polymerase-associated protein RapA n=1 Tax=Mesocricetibacter intestinalis TaxID=1521930 RepID=A0A4R6V9Q1_9PAST|nr:RNA polymerase-associated protein RapA [Mesocricetibacter intestinalis]TDQ56209.1 ATP-dependent helicase HepA [Mesocricetibacter intestinalis]